MSDAILTLLVISALGSGLMAGLFCAFSNFVMRALASIPPAKGIAAMQSINVVIINPLFIAAFVGTAVLSLAAVVMGVVNLGVAAYNWAAAGGAIYLTGCFAVTAMFNVPLNNKLAAARADSKEAVGVWNDYLTRWTRWNHLRSIATLASTTAFVIAIYYA